MRIATHGFAASSILFLTAFQALAQDTGPDYVFNVPVRIENARHLTAVIVQCSVRASDATGRWLASPSGVEIIDSRLVDGAFRSTARVEVRLPAGVTRSNVREWHCDLLLNGARNPSGTVVDVPGATVEERVAGYTTVTGQRVTSSRVYAAGRFPR